ncbi:hypothetical protein T02_8807 [Trichinella nativa]|uniref:Uncharacterized protein n=1 Tax=Trichinella nativa TaxID=6335 RepID=A0A0V1KKV4_9BILA|nr:hypothetical protein T02_8807 [Trichinella nativa]
MPTVRLIFSKNDRIIEFYAFHDLNYSLGISLIPSMSQLSTTRGVPLEKCNNYLFVNVLLIERNNAILDEKYKCYYDHEHCLEDISRNFCIACLFSLPDTPTKIALSCMVFSNISADTLS